MTGNRLSKLLAVTIFIGAIAAPAIQQLTDLLPEVPVVDNRALAPFPSMDSRDEIVTYPERLEAWYSDHMGLRGTLVSGYRWLTDSVLRSPDKVIIGRDDWLYLRKGVREDIETVPLMRDWCGRFAFSKSQLDSWVAAISANHDWLAERGIGYLFVVPPNKMTVLPEHLPVSFDCLRGTTRLDQLKTALLGSGIELIDLRDVLRRSAESGTPIWFRTDTHWNARGVAAAYPALLDRLTALQPKARRIDTFIVEAQGESLGDLGRMVRAGVAPDRHWLVQPSRRLSTDAPTPFWNQVDSFGRRGSARTVPDSALPTALIFHDSFFDGPMNDFLSESFSRSVFVFHGQPEINRLLVEIEAPDLVIHEMVERNLLHPFFVR